MKRISKFQGIWEELPTEPNRTAQIDMTRFLGLNRTQIMRAIRYFAKKNDLNFSYKLTNKHMTGYALFVSCRGRR